MLENFPDLEGIKTQMTNVVNAVFGLENFPDLEGIKTRLRTDNEDSIPRWRTSLIWKGLRRRRRRSCRR